jgi:tellurite resistance protein TerC
MGVDGVGTPILWIGFTAFVIVTLVLDLGVFHRKAHAVSVREALVWTAVWVGLAMVFNLGVYFWFGEDTALEFLTGYVIEKSLSIDNIFVFIMVFQAFAVPEKLQHRVLAWGVLGAMAARFVFIAAGVALIHRFHWVIYPLGAFLVFSGVKLLVRKDATTDPRDNPLFRLFRRVIPSVPDYRGASFTVKEHGRRYATPLLLVVIAIEATDIVFAVDSIPAIFAVTTDPFIVFTSNIFALLGLRALYFALVGVIQQLRYIKVGLSLVLAFVGAKMLIGGLFKIPIGVSLGVIAALLGGSVVLSLLRPSPAAPADPATPP